MNPAAESATRVGIMARHAPAGEQPLKGRQFLRVMLGLQVVLGLLWGISMLFFASSIALGDRSGPHIEKIALEGGAHFSLVLGAILVWRAPRRARDVLLVMVFLNLLWALTDLVYIPLYALTAFDFTAKLIVNASLGFGLAVAAKRAGLLSRSAEELTEA
jgi:hypothetical protein